MADLEARDPSQVAGGIVNAMLAQTKLSDYSSGALVVVLAHAVAAEIGLANLENIRAAGLAFIPGLVGEDLDQRLADFGLTRAPASAAFGQVRFYRQWEAAGAPGGTDALPVVIPAGYTVSGTAYDGSTVVYEVRSDVTIAAGSTSAAGVVDALVPGETGNLGAARVSTLDGGPIVGLAGCGNDRAFGTGADDEPDDAFRERFYSWLDARKPGTVAGLRAGTLLYVEPDANGAPRPVVGSVGIVEHLDAPGADGQVVSVYVAAFDNGTLSAEQIADIQDYIDGAGAYEGQDPWRAAGCPVKVLSPVFLQVDIEVEVTLGSSASTVSVQRLRRDLEIVVNATPTGSSLYLHRLHRAICDAGVAIANSRIISPPGDIVAAVGQKVRAGNVVVRAVS